MRAKARARAAALAATAAVAAAPFVGANLMARSHGARAASLNVGALARSIGRSPVAEGAGEVKGGRLVLSYKFGCPDCEATYAALMGALGRAGVSDEDLVCLPSDSEGGEAFCEAHGIEEVPSLTYVDPSGADTTYVIYDVGADGASVLDAARVEELCDLYLRDMTQ